MFDQYNFVQLVREPTHFTENSLSLTDLIFTKNERFVIFSEVGEDVWTRLYNIIALSSQCLFFINARNNASGGRHGSMMKLTMYI